MNKRESWSGGGATSLGHSPLQVLSAATWKDNKNRWKLFALLPSFTPLVQGEG